MNTHLSKLLDQFAQHAQKISADAFLVCYPERYYGDDSLFNFYKILSQKTSIGILIHELPLRNGLGSGTVHYSIELLERLFNIENIIGLKEESLDVIHSSKIMKKFSKTKNIIGAGGGMSRYLKDYRFGASAYLSGIGNFEPSIELEFFNQIQNEQYDEAFKVVHNKELPFFETVIPMGWHPSLKEVLELKGLISSATENQNRFKEFQIITAKF